MLDKMQHTIPNNNEKVTKIKSQSQSHNRLFYSIRIFFLFWPVISEGQHTLTIVNQ